MSLAKRLIISLVSIQLSFFSFAQKNGGYKFKRITIDHGLSQSYVECILEDTNGFRWFGTHWGLNRYDGTSFKTFLHNPTDSTSLANNIIYAIHQDSLGFIWVGTQEGLSIFDPVYQQFINIKKFGSLNQSSESSIVKAIFEDHDHNFWIGTFGDGLHKITIQPGDLPLSSRLNISSYYGNQQNPHTISSNFITAIAEDSDDYLWIGTNDNGLNKFDPIGAESTVYKKEDRYSIAGNQINSLFVDEDGEVWVGTDEGLNRIRKRNNNRRLNRNERIITYQYSGAQKNSISHNSITSVIQGKSGLLYIGTDGGGLNQFNKSSGVFTPYQHNISESMSLISNSVSCIMDDSEGTLWIGTNSGISQLSSQRKKFKLYQKDANEIQTISSNYIQDLYKERNGIIWVATNDGGLNQINSNNGKITVYTTEGIFDGGVKRKIEVASTKKKKKRRRRKKDPIVYTDPPTVNHMNIRSLHRDTNFTLWIGTGGGGLNKLSLKNGKIEYFTANSNHPDSLSNNSVNVIYEDQKGTIWLGTEGGGLNQFDGKKFKHYKRETNNPKSLVNNDVRAITADQFGTIWVGTFGGGLSSLNPETGEFTNYAYEQSNLGLKSKMIFCLYADNNNLLWIGTSDGLGKYDLVEKEYTLYSIQNGLPNNLIYGIVEDKNNDLWLSTNHGLSRFKKESETFNNYDQNDGLQSNEFIPGSYTISKRGEVLFGGIKGFNSFYPESVQDNENIPNVIITDFKIFNKTITPQTNNSPLLQDISETKSLELSYKDAVFGFEFIAVNFSNANKNQYAYKMENFDSDWNFIGNRTYANYTNLAPGKYKFKVKASNNDGIWNEEGTAIEIIITPPFWLTWWFRTLSFLIILATGFGLYKWRVKRIEFKKKLLEKEVRERTTEIMRQKDELEEKNEEILTQRNNIEEKNKQLEKAWGDIVKVNNELKEVNVNLEQKVEERTAKLQEAIRRLVDSNQELDTFLYRASHDLKGPLTRLLGLTQLARIDPDHERSLDYIHKIERSSVDMDKTLNKLINIHSINTKPVNLEKIDINTLVDHVISIYRADIKTHKVKIEKFIDAENTVNCDIELLKIIIDNLFENALIFKKESGSKIAIRIACDHKNMAIKIEDNGMGIRQSYLKKVFDMFFRGSEISKGNGLGLYLVKKAIEKLNGKIDVESKPGSYTVFNVLIPHQPVEEPEMVKV